MQISPFALALSRIYDELRNVLLKRQFWGSVLLYEMLDQTGLTYLKPHSFFRRTSHKPISITLAHICCDTYFPVYITKGKHPPPIWMSLSPYDFLTHVSLSCCGSWYQENYPWLYCTVTFNDLLLENFLHRLVLLLHLEPNTFALVVHPEGRNS